MLHKGISKTSLRCPEEIMSSINASGFISQGFAGVEDGALSSRGRWLTATPQQHGQLPTLLEACKIMFPLLALGQGISTSVLSLRI